MGAACKVQNKGRVSQVKSHAHADEINYRILAIFAITLAVIVRGCVAINANHGVVGEVFVTQETMLVRLSERKFVSIDEFVALAVTSITRRNFNV